MRSDYYRCSVRARFICARLPAADVLVGGSEAMVSAGVFSAESPVSTIVTDDVMLSLMS